MSASRSPSVDRNIVYRNLPGDRQALDLYRGAGPAPEGGRPVLVAIHGGGWARFSKNDYGRRISVFTRQGFVVVAPNYRLSRPGEPSWPTNFDDVREVVRWVRRNAESLGANPDRVAAIGESAGGHLAELLGTSADDPLSGVSSRVDAVVSFYGPSNLNALGRSQGLAGSRTRQFLGSRPDQSPDRYAEASPLSQVSPDDAPALLIHGTADSVVPPSQSVAMARRLKSEGVRSRLILVRGVPHGFSLNDSGRNLSRTIARFLRAVMP